MILIFQTLTYIFGDMLNSVGAAGKVFEYLDRKALVSTDGKLQPDQLRGHISFRSLNFSYPANPNKTVLQVRWQDRWVVSGGVIVLSIYSVTITTAVLKLITLFRTFPWS